jgi:hypothetical protein
MNALSSSRIADTVNRSSLSARGAVAVIAVGLIGWLVVMERDARLLDRGIAASGRLDDPATVARAEADLRAARLLSPDRTPDIWRALVLGTTRRPGARALLEDVVRAEPDNLSAWTALGWVAGGDEALERRVAAEMRRLDPLNGGRRSAPPQTQ